MKILLSLPNRNWAEPKSLSLNLARALAGAREEVTGRRRRAISCRRTGQSNLPFYVSALWEEL
jgi:hypothetical protein